LIVLRNGLVDVGAGKFVRADIIVDGDHIHSVTESAPACGLAVNCTNYAVVALIGDGGEPGRIEAGQRADLVLLDLKPATPAVSSVMVGGEWRIVNGVVKGLDATALESAADG
jgi:adenine deaminase